MNRRRKFKIGDVVKRKRDGVEVTVVGTWYDRNAEAPAQLVLPVLEVEEHLNDNRREYMFTLEVDGV